jgi:glycosyltransferase involved in cell wall biosynthesis
MTMKEYFSRKSMPNISVIICAYNRSQSVAELLDCLLVQESDSPFEVMVVDNNSKDNTREVVESYIPRFGSRLRYFFEPRQGKSFALNSGIRESRGEILAFLDDDCLVKPDYVNQINKVFEEHGTNMDFYGGKIDAHWVGGSCPPWLSEIISDQTEYSKNDERYWRRVFFRGPLAILDYGKSSFPVDSTQENYKSFLFYGPNMGVRKSALEKIGGYALDRVITQDTEVCLRLIQSRMKGVYVPSVVVEHKIPAAKIVPEFYYQWYSKRGKFLEAPDAVGKSFYDPLGISWRFILKTIKLSIKSLTVSALQDKVYFRSQAFFNLAHMGKIAKKNIV